MAVNCVVIRNGIPVPLNREQFLHLDEGVSLSVEPASGGFSATSNCRGRGKIYTTNFRLIFLKENPSAVFSSFCVPYLNIESASSKGKSIVKMKKQLFGGCIVCGKVFPIRNGGLPLGTLSKFEIKFDDTGAAKQFYNTLDGQLKIALRKKSLNSKEYEQACNTASLPVEHIFPDQFSNHNRNFSDFNSKSNNNTNSKNKNKSVLNRTQSMPASFFENQQNYIKRPSNHIVASQTHSGAPLQLTSDYRTHEAKLFGTKNAMINASHGPVMGASPAVIRKPQGTRILDENAKIKRSQSSYNDSSMYSRPMGRPLGNRMNSIPIQFDNNDNYTYAAFMDPSNPDDIVVSMPSKDDFDQKINNNNNSSKNYNNNNSKNDNSSNDFFVTNDEKYDIGESGINLDDMPDIDSKHNVSNVGNSSASAIGAVVNIDNENVSNEENDSDESSFGGNSDLPPKIASSIKPKPQPMSKTQLKRLKQKNNNNSDNSENSETKPQAIAKLKSLSEAGNANEREFTPLSHINDNQSRNDNNNNNNENDNPFELLSDNVPVIWQDKQVENESNPFDTALLNDS